jgi:ribosomal protein S18 acetylase RimI-like enzyme
VDGDQAQLGPIVADVPGGARCLLGDVLAAARRAGAARAAYFGLQTGGDLEPALVAAGFSVTSYAYLSRALERDRPAHGDGLTGWKHGDVTTAAHLLQAAYGVRGRFFAPDGRLDQWERYVGNLIAFTGCGVFDAASSRVARDGDRLTGLALVTTIRPGVAHLAQLAVHPCVSQQGLGGRLLDHVMACAAARGHRRMTLLVEAASPAPMRLYASRGFTQQARFVAGWLAESIPADQAGDPAVS